MKTRLKFECWKCKRHYSLLLELEGKPKLDVECPFCGKESIVNLASYQEDIVEIFRSGQAGNKDMGAALNLPDVIPTTENQREN